MTQKANPWTFDVRVRERNLKAGTITDKDVEKYVGGLPDLADQSEPFGTSQPALAQPVHEPVSADLGDDEDDDDDDDDLDDGADGEGDAGGGGGGEGGGSSGETDPSSPE
jgi:hypothetical protein